MTRIFRARDVGPFIEATAGRSHPSSICPLIEAIFTYLPE